MSTLPLLTQSDQGSIPKRKKLPSNKSPWRSFGTDPKQLISIHDGFWMPFRLRAHHSFSPFFDTSDRIKGVVKSLELTALIPRGQ